MTTSYLEQLLDRCASLKLVISPPHPQAFIQGRADQAQALLAELEMEVGEIEKQDAPTFELIELQDEKGEWVGFEPETIKSDSNFIKEYCQAIDSWEGMSE